MFDLDNGDAIVLTVAKICPYISACFDGEGISPDIYVSMSNSQKDQLDSQEFSVDDQYKAAYDALS